MFFTVPVVFLAAAATTLAHPMHEPKPEPKPYPAPANITDIDILQYALTLEHLGEL